MPGAQGVATFFAAGFFFSAGAFRAGVSESGGSWSGTFNSARSRVSSAANSCWTEA
jgi:hypothetical protein